MKSMYGYTDPLLILPFDHRASFVEGLYGTDTPDEAMQEKIRADKRLIYEALLQAKTKLTIPPHQLAVLIDEEYGSDILSDAKKEGLTTLQATEKSGQAEFQFEYGEDFGKHLLRFQPTFAKALLRYNPEDDAETNRSQRERLRVLSFFCHQENIKLLIEALIPATEAQLDAVNGEKERYDAETRPALTAQLIREFQDAGIEVDVWKIEGFAHAADYEQVVVQMQNINVRKDVGLIILGRNETKEKVAAWIEAGKNIPGVIGFAVGRTVFWEPLLAYHQGTLEKQATRDAICENFLYFCNLFLE